jgi:phage major head subunit gpT-like protein
MLVANFGGAFDLNVKKAILDTYNAADLHVAPVFNVQGSKRKSEKVAAFSGFGAMPEKGEGAKVAMDDPIQRFTYELTHKTYALAFKATEEMVEDQDIALVNKLITSLGRSGNETVNVTVANILNRAFNSSYTYGDGKELCATDHPTAGGTEQNELTSAADLANASLNEAMYTMHNSIDHRGKMLRLKAKRLIVAAAGEMLADQVVDSQYEYNASSGALNKNFFRGKLQPVVNPYLTDDDAWWIQAEGHGLVFYWRVFPKPRNYTESETGDLIFLLRMRLSVGVEDWPGLFGSPGA